MIPKEFIENNSFASNPRTGMNARVKKKFQ